MREPRTIKRIGIAGYKIYEVDSHPGDATIYKFIIYNTGNDYFYFTGLNHVNYPNQLHELSIIEENPYVWDICLSLAAITNCSPHTIKECITVAGIISRYKEGE